MLYYVLLAGAGRVNMTALGEFTVLATAAADL